MIASLLTLFQILTLLLFSILCLEFGFRTYFNRYRIGLENEIIYSGRRFQFF
jgi:hypothetical protein